MFKDLKSQNNQKNSLLFVFKSVFKISTFVMVRKQKKDKKHLINIIKHVPVRFRNVKN